MNKRVHQIAKERGLASKEVIERLKAAGLEVKAASSSVDEDVARRVLDNGAGNVPAAAAPAAERQPPPATDGADGAAERPRERPAPTGGQAPAERPAPQSQA